MAVKGGGRRSRPAPEPLRRDVRLLTTLLGDAIRAHDGEALYDTVESLRRAVIGLHERPTPSRAAAVRRRVAAVGPDDAVRVARAFTAFFQLVNVAEDRQRVRALRERGARDVPETLDRPVELTEVLTAHPTEAKRRAVVEHLWRISDTLDELDDPRCAGRVRTDLRRRLAEDVASLWLTDPIRLHAPTPLDEVRATMALFDRTIFTTLPQVLRSVGPDVRVRWATWVGGDRDGNPRVTAEVTTEAARIARDHVLRGYETAARRIARALSVSAAEVPASPPLRRSLALDARAFPARAAELERTLPDAPHRRKLVLVAERLAAAREGRGGAYDGPGAFRRDVALVRDSLRHGGAAILGDGDLANLAWQADAFGFHLAAIEVRQHASVLRRALREPDAEVEATFAAIAALHRDLGPEACPRFVISFTREAADVAAVHTLARRADRALPRRLDVVPLFESGAELANATVILDEILALPAVRARVRATDGRFEVMLGYSDSAKEAGVLAASIALYETQAAIASWARRRGLALTLFHGRGGALGRGGGPTARAIVAQPPGTVGGRFKVTEQGEVAFARYGDPDIAWHHLEQVVRAIAAAPGRRAPDPARAHRGTIAAMRTASERAWRDLVTTPGFARYVTAVTPIAHIASLPIASRPVSRTDTVEDLDALRAIPWVFAWSQSRVNLPGWYGLGSGLEAAAAGRGGLTTLRRLHRDWPFFAVLLENASLSLAKADRDLARRALERAERADITAAVMDEWDRTERLILAVTGEARLLDARPSLRASIDLRAPYVDALSELQLAHAGDRRVVQATIGGVAAGLQNTG